MSDTMPPTGDAAVAAERAAESFRELNYATADLRCPGEVYEVLGGLMSMAEQVPQACGQLALWLEREADNGRLRARGGPFLDDVPATVASASEWLTRAAGHAEQLRHAFANAQAAVGGLA